MDRYNFFYRQKVMEDELDSAFDACENADRDLCTDLDFQARTPTDEKAKYGGVMWGFGASNPSSLDISIASGAAYDESSQRIYTGQAYTVTATNEGDVESAGETVIGAGGTPAGASTDPGDGNSVWVTVYIAFARLNSQERFDGYNIPIWYQNSESFYFHVAKGAVKATGSLELTDKPARLSSKVLLVDVKIKNDGGVVSVDGALDVSRTEWYLNIATTTGLQSAISQKGNVRDALLAMLTLYNDHASGTDDKHKATQIIFDAGTLGTTWADGNAGTYGGSASVLAALTNLATDLKATASANSGAIRLGAKAQAGSLGELASTSPANLAAGTLEAQLTELLTAVNSRVFRGGDSSIAGALIPKTTGIGLGSDIGNKWDLFARDLKLSGDIKSSLVPDTTNEHSFGSATKLWKEIHSTTLNAVAANVSGLATFNGNTQFSGTTNTVTNALVLNGTTTLNGPIAPIGEFTAGLIPDENDEHDIGSDPTAAGKAWSVIHTQWLKAYNTIQIENGKFIHKPANAGDSFTIYTDSSASTVAVQMKPNKVTTNESVLDLNVPALIDPTNSPPTSGGAHALRIVPAELGLDTALPKMPLAFGPEAATGGMNQYGAPIRNWHFRDDFMYNPDSFDHEAIDGTAQTHPHYTITGTAGYAAGVSSTKGLNLTCASAENVILSAGGRLQSSYNDWIMHGKVELDATTNVQVEVGWSTASSVAFRIQYYATDIIPDRWKYYAFDGVSSEVGYITDGVNYLEATDGPVYFTLKQINSTQIYVFAKNNVRAFGHILTLSMGGGHDWAPYIKVGATESATKKVYLHYWEWYRQTTPIY